MNESLKNIVKLIQSLFKDKELVKEDMMSVALDVDYHEGGYWGVSPLFFKDLVNYKVITPDTLNLIAALKELNVISAVVTEFGPGCDVKEHSDADLIKSEHIIRMFIPLEPNYRYKFSGMFFEDGYTINDSKHFYNEAIIFVPTLNHSFKNFSEKSQFFIIADVATDDKKLTKEFWDSYLYFSVSNYIR